MQLFNKWSDELGNPTNVYEANSREANENLLLDTYLAVLTDKKNVDETRLPLDKVTGIIKDEILPIVDGKGTLSEIVPFRELSPTYQMNKKYEYSGGKTGIGPFALNNKNHVLTQLTNLGFNNIELLNKLGFTSLAGINSKDVETYKRNKYGDIILDEQGNPIRIQEKGLRILDWISAMINAHVDVAKDPYVIRLNVRQYTYNLCNFLLRAGYGKDTFYFLPQQILKDMADAYDRASGIYGVDESKSKTAIVKDEIINIRKRYLNKYEDAAKALGYPVNLSIDKYGELFIFDLDNNGNHTAIHTIQDFASDITDRDFLIDQLQLSKKGNLTDKEAFDYYYSQLLISELFLQLNELAQDMSKLVQLSQVDTKRFGNNFIEQDRFLYRLKSLVNNSVLFNSAELITYLNDTFLMTKINNGILGPSDMFSNIMIRGKRDFKDAISQVLTMINRIDSNDEALNKTIANELEGAIRWQFLGDINAFDMFYGDNTMAKRLARIKADILSGKYPEMLTQDGKIGNQLLNYLGTLTKMSTDKYNAPDIITKNRISDDDKYLKQSLNQYWEELLGSDYPEIKQFAQDLIKYQLITTAGNFTKNGIFNLLPIAAIQSTGYADYMRTATEQFNSTMIDFDNFFLNNWTNDKIVKPIQLYKKEFVKDTESIENVLQYPVLFSNNDTKTYTGKRYPLMIISKGVPVGRNGAKQNVYTPYIKTKIAYDNNPANTLLYKYVGNITDNKDIERPVYVIVDKKGLNQEGRVVKEYDSFSNSMFEFNNLSGSFNARSAIRTNDIKALLRQGNKQDYEKWFKVVESIEVVQDYIPTTVALQNTLDDLKEDATPTRVESKKATTSASTIPLPEYKQQSNSKENSFTFNNGKTVNTPFKLNQQQEHALLVLEDFINNPEKYDGSVTLSGYAGTGKTSIISIFNKYLASIGITPLFSAPTHRANAVTKMNNPESTVITLHSAFGLSPMVDLDKEYDLRKLKTEQLRKSKIKKGQLLIIDEASMINSTLYKFIEDFKKEKGITVIYMGDSAQLSPVSDDKISPVFENKATNIELTKVERTGDNPILEEATNLRNGKPLSFITKLVDGKGVEYMHDGDRPNQIIQEIVSSDEYKTNPFNFRILSATNAMLSTVNNMIRKQLFGENAKQIEVGDIFMGYDNLTENVKGESVEILRNSIDYKVLKVGNKISKKIESFEGTITEVEGYQVTLQNAMSDEFEPVEVFILDNQNSLDSLKAISQEIERLNREISLSFQNKQYEKIGLLQKTLSNLKLNTVMMKEYEENGKLKIHKAIDYGYAHTIHKSQGGTYNKVMIYYDTITDAAFDDDTQQQLKYVAVSRARDNVYVVTQNKLGTPIIENKEPVQQVSLSESWSKKEGWSEEYFNDKVLPRLNEAWQIEYKAVDQNTPTTVNSTPTMNFDYNGNQRSDVKSKSTIEAIKNGERIATTRYESDGHIDYWKQFKVGDVIQFVKKDKDGNVIDSVKVEITNPLTKLSQETASLYCYAHHNADKQLNYYNEDGTLKDNPFTRTTKQIIQNSYSGTIKSLESNQVFVFGSNTQGRHGKGAALTAKQKFGAVYGQAEGPQGQSYAIITKDLTKPKHPSRTKEQIIEQIGKLYEYAKQNPDKEFLIAYSGTGANLNAYSNQEMADMFSSLDIPQNIVFEESFSKLIKQEEVDTRSNMIDTYVNHSGGAQGADSIWGEIGEEYGVKSNHYYTGETSEYNAPKGNVEISKEDYEEGRHKVAEAAKYNYGYQYSTMKDPRLIRNWAQVKYADAIFAIGKLVNKGQKLFPNRSNDTRVATNVAVTGGTGYAVAMAIQAGKPVYVFDQNRKQWYKNIDGKWSKSDTPTLTKNFAGIGTREINETGIQAIRDVYENTFVQRKSPTLQSNQPTINVYADTNENANLSNFAHRPFEFYGMKYNTVEGAFQAQKLWYTNKEQPLSNDMKKFTTATGSEARRMGRSVVDLDKAKWDKDSDRILKEAMKESFKQNQIPRTVLVNTGDAIITHKNAKGEEQDNGRFSRLLREVREELRNESKQQETISKLTQLGKQRQTECNG